MSHEPSTNTTTEGTLSLHIGRLPIDARIAVYSTIILMSGLALIDASSRTLGVGDWGKVFGAVIAPVAAVAVAHAFADFLGHEVHSQAPLTTDQRRHIILHNLQFLYPAVVTVIVVVPMLVMNVRANAAINLLLLLGLLSLVAWGTFAGRRVGQGFWGTVGYAVAYGCVGLLVVLVKYWLTH